jgi:diguanylate cyclase (GGDEF)-like protein
MVVVAACTLPFARVALPVVPVLLPMFGAIAAVAQLLTAAMLYSRYRGSGLPSVAILATLYATSLLTSLAFLVSMPDVAAQTGFFHYAARLGAWYYGAGCLLFVIQLVAYVAADDAERRNRNATARQIFARTFAASAIALAIGTSLVPLLGSPVAGLMQGESFFALRLFILVPLLLLAIAISYAYLNVAFRRRTTMVRLWLGVVVLATFFGMLVSMEFAGTRFSVGWLAVLAFWLVQSTVFLVAMVVNVYDTLSMLSLRNEALYEQSVSDEMTGLLNRRGFNLRFEEQVRRSARTEEALALLLIDIDDFKRFNDTYGHQSGDRAIAAVARVVASMLRRAGDGAARIGGDEFAVLLPKTDMAGAVAVAERIRGAVERLALAQGDGARYDHLTVTIGVTSVMLSGAPTLESNASLETSVLLGRADAALYAAKDAGRNCVRYRQISATPGDARGTSLAG